jgi:hypothetical protein
MDLHPATFHLDADPETTFQGYTDGSMWNGWACPYFEREVAEKVAQYYEELHDGGAESGYEADYDPERDAFVFREPAYDEPLVVESVEVGGQNLYPIGAYQWTWVGE